MINCSGIYLKFFFFFRIIVIFGRLMYVLVEMEKKLKFVEYVVFDEVDRY